MSSIPDAVPSQLRAGDTWQWTRDLADYPAGTWTLTYYFENKDAAFSFAATASGTTHSVTVAASSTSAFKSGRYRVIAQAVSGSTKFTAEAVWVDVLPDLTASGKRDHRTPARITADNLMDLIMGRATEDQLSMSIGGRSVQRMSKAELRQEWEKWNGYAKQEERAELLNAGVVSGKNRLQVRF